MNKESSFYIHPSAFVEKNVTIGNGSYVWHQCHVRENSILGKDVSLGKGVFIDQGVEIGEGCRIQNGVSVYRGVILKEWVFVGPNVTFTNDRYPRAGIKNWHLSKTLLMPGCSIGAGSVITCDITIGAFALIGAGSVLTESIAPFHLAYGLPAKTISKICACANTKLPLDASNSELIRPCCKEQLKQEVLNLAIKQIQQMQDQ